MQIEKRVLALVQEKIADLPDLFVVDIKMLPNNKLHILMDGDNGIKISDCVAISRHVGYHLEEENAIEQAYNLEVSSPGLSEPLKLNRQYHKNIGRNVAIKQPDGSKLEGKLESVNEQSIIILQEVKEKGKKAKTEPLEVLFENITETKILISFK